jgi:hypothetical protein
VFPSNGYSLATRWADHRKESEDASPHAMATVWFLAAVAVLLQVLTNRAVRLLWGELYFIATSKHLAFGYR